MAYLMEICFDNSCRLARKEYLFEYRDVRFKLVQDNPRKHADHLLTIVPAANSSESEQAFSRACEFVSALGWQNRARVAVWEAGGSGIRDGVALRDARPTFFTFPRVPFGGNVIGFDLTRLPRVQTDAHRVALALFREANASNSYYLAFLFYWQVLEVDGGDPVSFINKALRRDRTRLHLQASDLGQLALGSRSLGNYLLDDCRHAIAHIKRRPGRKRLDLDVPDERMRLAISTRVVKAFAEHYIREGLRLTQALHLVRPRGGGFPVYVDDRTLASGRFKRAYPAPSLRRVFGTRG